MRRATWIAIAAAAALSACGDGSAQPPPAPTANPHFQPQPEPAAAEPRAPRGRYLTARLIRNSILRDVPGGDKLATLRTRTEFGSRQVLAVVARRSGWLEVISSELSNRERGWIPAQNAKLGSTDFSLHVDRSQRRLHLRHRGRTIRTATIAVGRAGNETPLGRFAVTDKLAPEDPASPYGCCAVALSGHQTRLEPGWPGGDRLAIHGTPAIHTIGQAVSLGCMRAHEKDLRVLMRKVPLGAPVFIRA